ISVAVECHPNCSSIASLNATSASRGNAPLNSAKTFTFLSLSSFLTIIHFIASSKVIPLGMMIFVPSCTSSGALFLPFAFSADFIISSRFAISVLMFAISSLSSLKIIALRPISLSEFISSLNSSVVTFLASRGCYKIKTPFYVPIPVTRKITWSNHIPPSIFPRRDSHNRARNIKNAFLRWRQSFDAAVPFRYKRHAFVLYRKRSHERRLLLHPCNVPAHRNLDHRPDNR